MELKPHFKIMIVEDNDFYNKLLTRHIQNYISPIAVSQGFTFELFCYTTFKDFSLNLNDEIDFILCDYFLNDGYTAINLLELVNKLIKRVRVIVISKSQDIKTSIRTLLKGAVEFLAKDRETLKKSGHILEEMIYELLEKRRNTKLN
ncbi:MAG TPA: response regulator [Bacteroidia bacterium]